MFLHSAHPVIVFALFFIRTKVFMFQHGMTVSHGPFVKRVAKKIWYSLIPLILGARVVCSTSYARKKTLRKGVYIPRFLLRIVPFGIELPRRVAPHRGAPDGQPLRIGMAARLVPEKRFSLVLGSLSKTDLKDRFVIKIAGDGPELENLKRLAENLGKRGIQVHFVGNIGEMASFYETLDMLIFPSKEESFGLVVLEALAHGVPVAVFSDVGGAIDLIRDGQNGFILGDQSDLTALWRKLAAGPGILDTMREKIQKMDLSDYTIDNTRSRLDGLVCSGA